MISLSKDEWFVIISFTSRFPYDYKLISKDVNSICNLHIETNKKILDSKYLYWNKSIDNAMIKEIVYYYMNSWALDDDWDYILYVSLMTKNEMLFVNVMKLAHIFKRQDIVDKLIDINLSILDTSKYTEPIIAYNMSLRGRIYTMEEMKILYNDRHYSSDWIGYMTDDMVDKISSIVSEELYIDNDLNAYIFGTIPWRKHSDESDIQYIIRITDEYNQDKLEEFHSHDKTYISLTTRRNIDPTDTYEMINNENYEDEIESWCTDKMFRNLAEHHYDNETHIGTIIYERYYINEDKDKQEEYNTSSFYMYKYMKTKDPIYLTYLDDLISTSVNYLTKRNEFDCFDYDTSPDDFIIED